MALVSAFKTVTHRCSVYLRCFTSTKVRILAHIQTRRRRSCVPQARVGYLFYEYKSTNTDMYVYIHTIYYTRRRRSCAPQARVGYLFYEYKSTNTDMYVYIHTIYSTRRRRSCVPQARAGYLFYEYNSTNTDCMYTRYICTRRRRSCVPQARVGYCWEGLRSGSLSSAQVCIYVASAFVLLY
jgi:hypothetical protein